MLLRRQLLALAASSLLVLAGCGTAPPTVDAGTRQVLAPTGSLRVGVYPGSPTSMVRDAKTGEKVGVALELGLLVPKASPIAKVPDVDRAGMRVGVSQGSSSQAALGRLYKNATLVPADSLKKAQDMLRRGEVDAFATNKGILFEMLDELPGFQILDGRWGEENLAMAIPKGRDAGLPLVRQFGLDMQASGQLQAMVTRAGLRGTVKAP